MSFSVPESVSDCDCECGTGQTKSTIACPVCRKLGSTVNLVTPQNTLVKDARSKLVPEQAYHFCDSPECDVVYYNEQESSVFTTDELKNRVTIKDDSPETPLCYCFKVLKKHALEEIARTGTTDVFKSIQAKMKPGQSCFCEKSNPRGDTCVKDIVSWLDEQDISVEKKVEETLGTSYCGGEEPIEAASTASCCGGGEAVQEQSMGSCCGGGQVEKKPRGGCC